MLLTEVGWYWLLSRIICLCMWRCPQARQRINAAMSPRIIFMVRCYMNWRPTYYDELPFATLYMQTSKLIYLHASRLQLSFQYRTLYIYRASPDNCSQSLHKVELQIEFQYQPSDLSHFVTPIIYGACTLVSARISMSFVMIYWM